MQIWNLVEPRTGGAVCDRALDAPCALVSARGLEAAFVAGNPLAARGFALPRGSGAPALVVGSGWLEPESDDPVDAMDAARRTWSEEGRRRFEQVWEDLARAASEDGVSLWLRPAAGEVIGDIPGLRAIASAGGPPLLIEPAALLTEGMLADAEDHFVRMLDPLEATGVVRAVLVTDLAGEAGSLRRVPVGEGRVGAGVLDRLVERAAGFAPVAVLEADAARLAALAR